MEPGNPEGTQSAGLPKGTNKTERPGNGSGVIAKAVRFSKKSDGEGCWFDLLLVVAYCVQTRGRAGVTDVHDDITTRLLSKVHKGTLADALEALKKQEILAEGQDNSGNTAYSMKRFKFNCSPEISQGAEGLIRELRSDSTGALIIEKFTGDKAAGTKAKPRPCDTVDARATFLVTNPFLGSQVWDGNDDLQENYFDAERYLTLHVKRHKRMEGVTKIKEKDGMKVMLDRFDGDRPLMFERTWDGKIVASHAHSVQNFFVNAVEGGHPIGSVTRNYEVKGNFGFTDIIVEPDERQMTFSKRPVIRDERGPQSKAAGLKYYEALKAGIVLTMEFSFPSKNFATPEEVKFWLARVLRLCIRSMSPARGDQVGTGSILQKFEVRPWSAFDGGWQEV